MTEHKHIGKIVGALMAAAVAFCLIVALFADRFVAVSGSSAATMEYKSTLFDTSEIMTVNIIMDEDNGRSFWTMPFQKNIMHVTWKSMGKRFPMSESGQREIPV